MNVRLRIAEMHLADPMEVCRMYVWLHLQRLGIIGEWDAADVKRAKAAKYAGKSVDCMSPIEVSTLASELAGMSAGGAAK